MYGNIGGGNRLDFTCIGPAVNLAARLEKVAAKLGETIVASAAFARHFPGELVAAANSPSPASLHRNPSTVSRSSPRPKRPPFSGAT